MDREEVTVPNIKLVIREEEEEKVQEFSPPSSTND